MASTKSTITFDSGWSKVEVSLSKLYSILEGSPEGFTSNEYVDSYS